MKESNNFYPCKKLLNGKNKEYDKEVKRHEIKKCEK
jgi:hypothetical protein